MWIGNERPWPPSIRQWRECQYILVQIAPPEGWALLPDTTQPLGLHFTPKSENMLSVSMFLFFYCPLVTTFLSILASQTHFSAVRMPPGLYPAMRMDGKLIPIQCPYVGAHLGEAF